MLLIKNATVHTGKNEVFKKDVLIDEGKISKIGENLSADCEVFEANNYHIVPGFIDPMSEWGILGPGREIRGNTEDNDEHTNVITPEMNTLYAFDGRGITRQQLGAFGMTSVGVAPSNNNLFGGIMTAFEVDGVNPYKMCLKEDVGLKACITEDVTRFWGSKNICPSTHMGIFSLFENTFREAKEYDPSKGRDPKKETVKKVIDKKMPLFVTLNKDTEAHSLFRVLKDYDVDLVLAGGTGLQDVKEEIINKKPSIIVRAKSDGFDVKDCRDNDFEYLYDLFKQGINVCLATTVTGRMSTREDLLWNGLDMYKKCKDSEAVLSMLTINSAKVLGIDDITGSIEEGKRADLVVYSDNPIESFKAEPLLTLCGGRTIYKKGDAMKCFL